LASGPLNQARRARPQRIAWRVPNHAVRSRPTMTDKSPRIWRLECPTERNFPSMSAPIELVQVRRKQRRGELRQHRAFDGRREPLAPPRNHGRRSTRPAPPRGRDPAWRGGHFHLDRLSSKFPIGQEPSTWVPQRDFSAGSNYLPGVGARRGATPPASASHDHLDRRGPRGNILVGENDNDPCQTIGEVIN